MESLNLVAIGNKVKVERLFAEGFLRERMLALGLTKGAKVEVLGRGPSGDPTVYNIRGAMIALREEEARLVEVDRG